MARDRDELDPSWIRNQPALTTASGRTWLVVGGILAAASLSVFVATALLGPPGAALLGAAMVIALYAGIVVTQFTVAAGPFRLRLQAGLMLAMGVVALVIMLVVFWTEWSGT